MIVVSSNGTVRFQNKLYRCALGRSGVIAAAQKREGDGMSPAGIYPLRTLYYRPDKFACPPKTGLPVTGIQRNDGWCDDPADVNYNKPIKTPYAARHEKFWRNDDLYDLVVIIGHNDNPVVSGMGSCIFMHIAKPDYAPTEGCIALTAQELLHVLKTCNESSTIEIIRLEQEQT